MQFIKGMDVSMLKELEQKGAAYFLNGQEMDIFRIFKETGVNTVRLRLWNHPYSEEGEPYGGGTNDLETTIELAKRVTEQNLDFVLDLHYSDFWTDPSKQVKPKEWKHLAGAELEQAVYDYTSHVLHQLKANGIQTKMIQIGNEITGGLLWPEGHIDNVEKMAGLLNSGIRAAREFQPDIKIILHLDFGTDNELYRDWFGKIEPFHLDYDIIGMSYYPYWNGSLEKLLYNMNDISQTYHKDIIVAETAIGYTTDALECHGMIFNEALAEQTPYEASEEGQMKFMRDLIQTIQKVDNHRGIGFMYWEPGWLPIAECTWASKSGCAYIKDKAEASGNSWANQALFNKNGEANQVFGLLGQI